MKRRDLIAYLEHHGCRLLREGGSHSVWVNPSNGKLSTVSLYPEIRNYLAKRICKDLGIDTGGKPTLHEFIGDYSVDYADIEKRKDEPDIPFDEVVAELKKSGKI